MIHKLKFGGGFFFTKKNTGEMVRAQGKHMEFCLDWSVATLKVQLDSLGLCAIVSTCGQ